MEGFRDIVDAVGGIDVYNDLEFVQEGMHFSKGDIHLNGEQALKYTRMRYNDHAVTLVAKCANVKLFKL